MGFDRARPPPPPACHTMGHALPRARAGKHKGGKKAAAVQEEADQEEEAEEAPEFHIQEYEE